MKYVNGLYILSKTDIKKASAHTRRLARERHGQYNGSVDCYFDNKRGEFYYEEFVGSGWMKDKDLECIYSAEVTVE